MTSGLALRQPIAILDHTVVERIAAGEVIDRASSVVRELLDNALDAGATFIQIELRGGGLDLIRVADDGHGIEAHELALAFERHSTSKLRTLAELAELSTLGFRGEALPSIVAVAEVEIASCVGAGQIGRRALFRAGCLVDQGAIARECGTTVWVRNLFASMPARLRFLHEPRAEVAAVVRRVKWVAVAHPAVRLELLVDGRVLFRSSGSGGFASALAEAFGEDVRERLTPIGPDRVAGCEVEGLLTTGGLTRPSRQHLAIFVNLRRVRVAALDRALEAGYAGLLPGGRHPVGAMFITAPASAVDVNVHPSKEQVRLQREGELAARVQELVRAVFSASPREPERLEAFDLNIPSLVPRKAAEDPALWDAESRGPVVPRFIGQLHNALLLCEARQGLILVDQHRAHERVLFERLLQTSQGGAAQSLLEPAVVEVSARGAELIDSRLTELTALGFGWERFGDRTYRLTSAPVLPESGEILAFASEALLLAGERDDFWRQRLLATVACRSAVKKGRALQPFQALQLVEDLFHAAEPTICPHGSPAVLQLSRPFLRRQFRW